MKKNHANTTQKKARIVIFQSKQISEQEKFSRDKSGHYTMIKGQFFMKS